VAVLVLVTLVAAGCGSNSGSIARGRIPPAQELTGPTQPTSWKPCGGGFWCRTLQVPLDYSDPGGRQISLALIRRPATDSARRIGSVLLNPGGPGESGIQFLRGSYDLMTNLNQRLDLVSWDTRGVGESTPVMCLDGPHLDAFFAVDTVLDDPQEKDAFLQANKDFVAGCRVHSGYLLPFMDSESTARDMDQIRQALGDSKLTFFGLSYGTFIGQWYAHLFPTQVRALAFDGVVDSNARGPGLDPSGQVEGFQQNLNAFFAGCRSRSRCTFGRAGDGEQKLEAFIARVDSTPLPVGNRQLTRNLAMTGVLSALYDEASWPDLDDALTAVDQGDGAKLLDLADFFNERNPDGTYSNLVNGAADATNCLDSDSITDISQYDKIGPELAKVSPLFGPWQQYQGILCAYWPVGPKNLMVTLTISGAPPILLVGATDDPATPYADAVAVSHEIPGSVLLTREGNGHTSYFSSQCIQDAEDAYLTDLQLPPTGKVCRS
jgi:pimeloyl-ACP methyl ester carboxylesterase